MEGSWSAVLEQRDICRVFDMAPHVPIAGMPAVSLFNGKLQVNLLLLGNAIALHSMDGFSEYALPVVAPSKNPQEVRHASRGARVGVFGQPKRIHRGEGGEWKRGVWWRQFQGAGARHWILEPRNGLARGT